MKKLLTGIISVAFVLSLSSQPMNKLVRFTSSSAPLSDSLTFEFAIPFDHEYKVDEKEDVLTLYFTAVEYEDFNRHGVLGKIQRVASVKNVFLSKEEAPVTRVAVRIEFDKDKALLKFAKAEELHQLTVYVFAKKALRQIQKKQTTTMLACNDVDKKKSSSLT
jgi:hypothetical protein